MIEQNAAILEKLLERHDMAMWRAYSHVASGWCESQAGNAYSGIARIEKGIAELEASRTRYWSPFVLLMLADAHAARGANDQATTVVDKALDAANRQQEIWLKPELDTFKEGLQSRTN
jgi:hypothetical protein